MAILYFYFLTIRRLLLLSLHFSLVHAASASTIVERQRRDPHDASLPLLSTQTRFLPMPLSLSGRPDAAAWWTPAFQRRVDSMMRSVAEWSDGGLKEVIVRHCSDEGLGFRHCPNLIILKRNLLNWLDPSQHMGVVPDDYLNALPQDGDIEATSIARRK